MTKRTVGAFAWDGDFWAVVETWAQKNGFRLKRSDGAERTYQKGTGFLVAPMMFKAKRDARNVEIEAWVRANLFVRIMALFILPREMGVESGGFRGVLPRKIARNAVNELLSGLGRPPIS
jgi:hypothetical protein